MSKFTDFFTGNDHKRKAQSLRDEAAKIENKSAEELQKEGTAYAGRAASNKASQAKKQAKAASIQNGGNRLQAANAAANAAQEAASEGYDSAANAGTALAQAQDTANKNAQRNSLLNQANAEESKKSGLDVIGGIATTAASIKNLTSSDSNKKHVKHTYIPKEERINGSKN